MKLHPPIRQGILSALEEIFLQNRHADKVVDNYMKFNKKWGSRDRRLFAETTYNCVRWWRLLTEMAGTSEVTKVLTTYLENESKLSNRDELSYPLAIRESFPEELIEVFKEQKIANIETLLKKLNQQAPIYLRANTLKTTASELVASLAREEVPVVHIEEDVIRLRERKNVFQTEAYKKGLFEVQDWGSQKIAPMTLVKKGDRVIDACAGAGGKSLHLAAMMQNKGRIVSMDIHEWKLKELRQRASRNGVDIIEVKWIENAKTIKRLEKTADVVLLDVPCTGLGVLRRHPDTKWKFRKSALAEIESTQKDILLNYSQMVKAGGTLVYATCSLLPSENSEQVKWFLGQKGDEFTLEEEKNVSPIETDCDAFYVARLRRR